MPPTRKLSLPLSLSLSQSRTPVLLFSPPPLCLSLSLCILLCDPPLSGPFSLPPPDPTPGLTMESTDMVSLIFGPLRPVFFCAALGYGGRLSGWLPRQDPLAGQEGVAQGVMHRSPTPKYVLDFQGWLRQHLASGGGESLAMGTPLMLFDGEFSTWNVSVGALAVARLVRLAIRPAAGGWPIGVLEGRPEDRLTGCLVVLILGLRLAAWPGPAWLSLARPGLA